MEDKEKVLKEGKKSSLVSEEIDIFPLIKLLFKKAWIIVIAAVIVGMMSLGITKTMITPKYQSSFTAYINNMTTNVATYQNSSGETVTQPKTYLSSSDVLASQELVTTYSKIITSNSVLSQALEKTDKEYSYSKLKGMVSVSSEDSTQIITITVTSTDPQEATDIATALSNVAPKLVSSIVEPSSMQIIDTPSLPGEPSSPNTFRNIIFGILAGGMTAAAYIVLKYLFNNKISDEDDLESKFNIPVVGVIPDLYSAEKSRRGRYSYYRYGYGRKEAKESKNDQEKK